MEVYVFAPYHGAKALGMGTEYYFSSGRNIYTGQKILKQMLGHDCFYAAVPQVEVEFFLSKYSRKGPVVMSEEDIDALEVREEGKFASAMLMAISMLSDEGFVIGACLSPSKLASILSTLKGEAKGKLEKRLAPFCHEWIKRQFEEGAHMVILYDDGSSVSKELVDINVCYANGRVSGRARELEKAGFGALLVNGQESILEVRRICRLKLIGNLSAWKMKNWGEERAEEEARKCIEEGVKAGNFVFSPDGEVPYHTGIATLRAIVGVAKEYPD